MAATVRSVSNAAGSGSSVSVSSPSGSTTGDVLIAFQATYQTGTSSQPSTPSGWTLIRSESNPGYGRLTAFYRAWASGSTSFNNPTSHYSAVSVVAVQGANVEDVASSAPDTSSGASLALASAGTAAAGDALLCGIMSFITTTDATGLTPPSGMTERADVELASFDYGGGYFGFPTLGVATLDNLSAGAPGTKTYTIAGDYPENLGFSVLLGVAAAYTTHEADAALTVTASRTATATVEKFGAAASTVTATVTASGTLTRVGDGTATTTATTTATATVDRVGAAASTVTATITASADVETPGAVSGDVTSTTTAAITAGAVVERMASAALSVTAAITATLINESEVTPGTMRALTIEGATMRPAGSTAATMRVGLLGLNAATMTAVVSDEGRPTTIGVPVFAGPADPVTAGLITAGTAHVWFHDGTVFVQE
jgi:hypothetical protein